MWDAVRLLEQGLLFGLGALCIPVMSWLLQNGELPYEWTFIAPVAALIVVAGLIEAGEVRRTGRQRWIGSWLPAVLGVFIAIVIEQMQWHARYGAGAPPDNAMAMGLVMAAFLFGVPIFAVLVNAIAATVSRVSGPLPPAPASAWPQASIELLNVLARHPWLPASHAAAAVASIGVIMLGPPDLALQVLAAYAIADGVLAITASILSEDRSEARWWPAAIGLIGVGAGILALLWQLVLLVLIIFIAIWSVTAGIFQISGGSRWRSSLQNEGLIRFSGAVSLILGAVSLYLLLKLTV